MIDFHTHILPGVDDGSSSIEQSISMLEMMTRPKDKVDAIVASPHIFLHDTSVNEFIQKRDSAHNLLLTTTGGKNHPKFYKGAEVAISTELIDCTDIERLCIEGTDCLMLEMPYTFWSEWVYRVIETLIVERKLRIIIAHIDRYITKNNRIGIERLFSMDALMQLNADKICDVFSRRSMLKLIKDKKIAVLGSDCHNDSSRPPVLAKAFEIIEKSLGKDAINEIEQNEEKIIT